MERKYMSFIKHSGKYFLVLIMLALAVVSVSASRQLTIMRERSVLREGPGSFYEVIAELSVGEVLQFVEEEEDWYKVSYSESEGYLSPRMLEKAPQRSDTFGKMADAFASTDVSQHAMSAGIKGFGERFTQTFRGNENFLDYALEFSINTKQYKAFKKDTYRGINTKRIRRSVKIPKNEVPDFYSVAEEGLGLGIASRIAQLGIYEDKEVVEYINYVGNLIVEASDAYDNSFKFFVLDIENPNAYACPGGIVFITKGMLKVIHNEAELAMVLAHEIAHSTRFHGVIEMEQRKHQISADAAFGEMDSFFDEFLPDAVSQETKDLIKELDEEAFKIFETIIQGRLDQYEEEADYIGMIYAVRAGYDPNVFLTLLNRLITQGNLSNNEHYTAESNRMRIGKMSTNIRKIDYPSGLLTNRERYQSYMRKL